MQTPFSRDVCFEGRLSNLNIFKTGTKLLYFSFLIYNDANEEIQLDFIGNRCPG
jgi:hypothetical protein